MLDRILPRWEQQDIECATLVVEDSDYLAYHAVAKGYKKINVVKLPDSNRGINYSRAFIVKEADRLGCDRIIMSDDDIYPRPESDVNRLFEWHGLNTLGIGIMVPFYGLMFGNQTIKNEDRPLMSKGALGKRLFSLNVQRVLAIGNFDVRLHSGWGDDELVRQGMAALQATWSMARASPVATHKVASTTSIRRTRRGDKRGSSRATRSSTRIGGHATSAHRATASA
jgi:hypothetical protein